MMDISIDGCLIIHSAWPESIASSGPVHTLEETALHMRGHGMPRATISTILDIERTALRKLRHNPVIQDIYNERYCHDHTA